jgi:hypothetical protein
MNPALDIARLFTGLEERGATSRPTRQTMVRPHAQGVHADGANQPRYPAFPQHMLRKNQSWLKSWAQTATIPTNSVIDARAAASSTKIRNMIASLGLEHRGNIVPFLF